LPPPDLAKFFKGQWDLFIECGLIAAFQRTRSSVTGWKDCSDTCGEGTQTGAKHSRISTSSQGTIGGYIDASGEDHWIKGH